MEPATQVDITVVIPCLDEEEAVGSVVQRAWEGIERSGLTGEVVVVDNGSTDRSAAIAERQGARVVSEPERGYGNAYLAGLATARGRYIVMGDADETYDFGTIPEFVRELRNGADMVLGTRLKGRIHATAMPWAHRWIGNPLITGMINLMFDAKVSDAYCGLRAIRRDALPRLDLRSPGMEFALEMVLKAARNGLVVREIPIEYHPRRGDSKLSSLSDGWRSVKFILLHSPSYLFFVPAAVVGLPALIGALALATGPVDAFGRIWQFNALCVCVAGVLLGTQIAQLGLVARTFGAAQLGDPDPLLSRLYSRFRLEHALVGGAALLGTAIAILVAVFASWASDGYAALRHDHPALVGLALAGLGVQVIFTAFLVSIVGRPVAGSIPPPIEPAWTHVEDGEPTLVP
jgi:glycosyltransferase involved in cell wall biosynthesis